MASTNRDRVLALIRAHPDGVSDTNIGAQTGIRPHAQVNQICRQLADRGLTLRVGPRGRILNKPVSERDALIERKQEPKSSRRSQGRNSPLTVARLSGNAARVLDAIEMVPAGLTSREILERTGVRPIHQINQICQRLERAKMIERIRSEGGFINRAAPQATANREISSSVDRLPRPTANTNPMGCGAFPTADAYLVACVKTKIPGPVAARDLYTSAWFENARTCVERTRKPWWILSAEYRLLSPTTIVQSYERTLNTMGVSARREWSRQTIDELLPHVEHMASVCLLAGQHYREHLVPALRQAGLRVSVPMEGLSFGQQLSWLVESALGEATP